MNLRKLVEQYTIIKSLRPASCTTYASVAQTFINNTGINSLENITEDTVIQWKEHVAQRSSETTYNNYHRHMRALLNHAQKREIIKANPFSAVSPYRRENVGRKACEINEVRTVLSHLQEDGGGAARLWSTLIQTIYYTGMRRAQVCGLTWGDIDFDDNAISLRKSTSKNGKEWLVPLDHRLKKALADFRQYTEELGPILPYHQIFKVQLFSDQYSGTQLTPPQISETLYRLAITTDTKVSAHKLRHLFGTIIANQRSNGEDIPIMLTTLQKQMGHENIMTTTGYIQIKLDSQRQMVKGLDTLL